jgi:4'-phosphopantetheinyl transferase
MPASRQINPTPLRSAADHAVRLWQASLEHPDWTSLLPLLSGDELRRAHRFSFERDVRRYVTSHAVLRIVLGRLTGTSPGQVVLGTEEGGRPVLGDGSKGLHVSLSRSGDLVLVGVASHPLGVDLESLAVPMDVSALPGMVFSRGECELFERTRPESRREVLLRYWTRKEAILKAAGLGLSINPQMVEVLRATDGTLASLGTCWEVHDVLPDTNHVGAVAFALT